MPGLQTGIFCDHFFCRATSFLWAVALAWPPRCPTYKRCHFCCLLEKSNGKSVRKPHHSFELCSRGADHLSAQTNNGTQRKQTSPNSKQLYTVSLTTRDATPRHAIKYIFSILIRVYVLTSHDGDRIPAKCSLAVHTTRDATESIKYHSQSEECVGGSPWKRTALATKRVCL